MSDSHLMYFVGCPGTNNIFIVGCPNQAENIAEKMREAGKISAKVLGEPASSEAFLEGSAVLVKQFYENGEDSGWLEWEILMVYSDLSYVRCGKSGRLIPGKFIMAFFERPDLPITPREGASPS